MKSILKVIVLAAASVALSGCVTLRPPPALGAGDWVLARWQPEDPYFYPAIVTERVGDQISLQYDDGDAGTQAVRNVRRFDWRAGTRLECRWVDESFKPATITELASNRVDVQIRYDDGGAQATTTAACRDR
jgi:hypothetical protein